MNWNKKSPPARKQKGRAASAPNAHHLGRISFGKVSKEGAEPHLLWRICEAVVAVGHDVYYVPLSQTKGVNKNGFARKRITWASSWHCSNQSKDIFRTLAVSVALHALNGIFSHLKPGIPIFFIILHQFQRLLRTFGYSQIAAGYKQLA